MIALPKGFEDLKEKLRVKLLFPSQVHTHKSSFWFLLRTQFASNRTQATLMYRNDSANVHLGKTI